MTQRHQERSSGMGQIIQIYIDNLKRKFYLSNIPYNYINFPHSYNSLSFGLPATMLLTET